jgi:hypothetical protein
MATEQITIEPIRNGHIAVIACEGQCSGAYADDVQLRISKMRAAGYSPEQVRAELSAGMVNRPHRFTSRVVDRRHLEVRLGFSCLRCGHERTYGAEEL